MNIILGAFEKRVFVAKGRPDIEAHNESSNTDDEDDFNFKTQRELTPRSVIPDFSIDRLYDEEQPDATDMPDLESQESAVQRRKQ